MIFELLILGIYPLLSMVALFALRQSRLTGRGLYTSQTFQAAKHIISNKDITSELWC